MLLRKLALITVIVFVLSAVVRKTVLQPLLPDFFGNITLLNKVNYLKKDTSINLVFLGDSKTENQVNTAIFDSVTDHVTSSFNLGCNGLIMPESEQLLDKILDLKNIKYVIYEVRCAYHIRPENLHITRTTYCENWDGYSKTINNTIHSFIPEDRKISIFASHTICFIEYCINFSSMQGVINYEINKDMETGYEKTKGFHMPDNKTLAELTDHPEVLAERKVTADIYLKDFYNRSYGTDYNHYYQNQLQRLVNKANSRNIKLIFMVASSLRDFEYKELFPVLTNLKNTDIIVMCDGGKYPQLYKVSNNREADHYNASGSVFFSKYLGEEFNRINAEQDKK
jgi:hypothetical protein